MMTESGIAINQVIRNRDGECYRILWVESTFFYWIPLLPNHNIPKKVMICDFLERINSGEYSYTVLPDFTRPKFQNLQAAIEKRDHIWELIGDVVLQEPAVYNAHERAAMLKRVEEKKGVKATNLYRYIGKYWQNGKILDALFPDYTNVGRTKDRFSESAKKPGRKGTANTVGKKLTKEDVEHFESAYQTYHIKGKYNLKDTYTNMTGKYYASHTPDGKIDTFLPPEEIPSLGQFYYWHSTTKKPLDEIIKTTSEKEYNLRIRGGTGRTETHLYGPCALAQIDATIADIFLVRRDNRTAIIGRPTVYFVLDAFSHMVTGVHISLNKPSWQEASLAILNSIEDKVLFCRQYGLEIAPENWPCNCLPTAIVGDRGEMDGYAVEKLVNRLGIQIQNTPPYRGDLKAIVESHFKIMNYSYAVLPGYVEADFGKRCSTDYRLDAILDIQQFTQIVLRCILFHNNIHYMDRYPLTNAMRQSGVLPIALNVWNYGIQYLSGVHRVLSAAFARYEILPSDTGSITRFGILFKGMYYTCQRAEDEQWFAEARIEGRSKISVSYDPRNMAFIYVKYGEEKDPVECHLVEFEHEKVGITFNEAAEIIKYDNEKKKQHEYEETCERAKLIESIKEIEDEAKRQMKGLPKKSNAARVSEISDNCKKEIQAQVESATRKSVQELNRPLSPGESTEVDSTEKPASESVDRIEQIFQDVYEREVNKNGNL